MTSAEPFGANIAANNPVSIVSAIAKIYGSGVIRSNTKRKNEVTLESSVRRLGCDELACAPAFEEASGMGIETVGCFFLNS
jgi:hypothetical protein